MVASAVVLDMHNTSNRLDFESTMTRNDSPSMVHNSRYVSVAMDDAAKSTCCLTSPELYHASFDTLYSYFTS